ncbi:spore germination protein [Paenibacillus cisolokensis]|uniref:spore germination protein n=1 Tax=Paenibacillus cisolokensis TaxID=1658519 RepID=UPI003D2AC764
MQEATLEKIAGKIFGGEVVIWADALNDCYYLPAKQTNDRQTEESGIEVSIRGPRDGLVENIDTNIGLIRKRFPAVTLAYQSFTIGNKTKTKVGLLYDTEMISEATLKDVQSKLGEVRNNIEELISANQLEEIISDNPYSIFPLSIYTGRPDFITSCLLKGRFAILIDGVPGALIAPATLSVLLKTAEDSHFNYISSSFGRILRYISLAVAIFLPSFYVALTGFHQDQIPFPMLATIGLSRLGIPFSIPMEVLLMLGLIEIFREAGFRLPTPLGQSITVVGGLIIGDAAIRAGLTSPTMVVIVAISVVAGSTLVSQALSGTVSVLRIVTVLLASILGMFGFMLSIIFVVVYLSTLTSYGVAYLAPLSPINFKDVVRAVLQVPQKWIGGKPKHLKHR